MSAFSQLLEKRAGIPARTIEVPTSAFADDWNDRPSSAVTMGLRHIADADMQGARAEAAKFAYEMHPEERDEKNRVDCFNDMLMRLAVARATCQPDDIKTPYFAFAEDMVRIALTSDGVRFLWDELQRFVVETSPVSREASDEDLSELITYMTPEHLASLPANVSRPFRRLLASCLDLLDVA